MKMTNHTLQKKKKKSDTLKRVRVRKEAAARPALTSRTVTMSQRTVVDCSSLPFFLLSSVTHFLALLKHPIGESFKVRPWCALEPVFYSGMEEKFFHFTFLFLVLIWLDSLLHFDLQWVFPTWRSHIQKLKDCKKIKVSIYWTSQPAWPCRDHLALDVKNRCLQKTLSGRALLGTLYSKINQPEASVTTERRKKKVCIELPNLLCVAWLNGKICTFH